MRVYVFIVLLLVLGVWDSADGRRKRYKPTSTPEKDPKKEPVVELLPAKDINMNQMSGRWYLLSIASRCKYLLENVYKVEANVINLTPGSASITISTFTKHNFQCWEIQQQYESTQSSGVLLLRAKIPVKNIDVVVVDTDYSSYAIIVYKRMKQITTKLYGRSTEISDAIVDKFEGLAKEQNLGLDTVLQFPNYGFCESADKEHTLVMS